MKTKLKLHVLVLAILCASNFARGQGTAFTYQGQLNDNGAPADGNYDLQFTIFDVDSGGIQLLDPLTNSAVGVSNGLFTVTLDFGAGVFDGTARWLEIGVRTNATDDFVTLSPRQPFTASPYAIFAGTSANVASGAVVTSLNGLKDDVILEAGNNVTLTPNGNRLTIDAANGGGSSIWSQLNNNAYYNLGNVGIGTTSPQEKLTLAGVTSYNTGLKVTGNSSGGTGIALENTSSGGHKFDLLSGGAGDGIGVGAFGIFDESTGTYGFSITPTDDVGIGKNINFGSTPRQMLNMFGTGFGIGVQTADMYFRTGAGFAWYVGGSPNIATYNSGGGTTVATLDLTTGLDFGSRLGQHLSLWGGVGARRFDIGIQASTIYFRTGNGAGDAFAWYKGGIHDDNQRNAGGGQSLMTLDGETGLFVAGPANVCTLTIRGGCDLAEPFPVKEEEIEKGSVVVIDKERPGQLKRSVRAYDKRVAGIVSGANGINSGISLHQEGTLEGGQNVALTGRVYVLAEAESGEIEPGDLLTTSDTPGRAMKVTDQAKAQGAILGKAMSGLKNGRGMVLVLVTLQ
jgi:hypothetical protein